MLGGGKDSESKSTTWLGLLTGPQTKSFLSACFYGFVSVSITFWNKSVFSLYAFSYPNVLTLVQMIISLLLLMFGKRYQLFTYPDFNWATARKLSPLALSFIGMVVTGLAGLQYLNIPMYNALRRLATLVTVVGEWYLLKKKETPSILFSLFVMTLGALVAAVSDFDYNFIGYIITLWNCGFTAGYLLYIAKFNDQLNTWAQMFYMNLLSLPWVFLICWWTGELSQAAAFPHLWDIKFQAFFIFSAAQAFLLNYTIFLCTQINSALTTSVVGQMKNILTTGIGYFAFNDVTYSFWNVVGLFIGTAGSLEYSYHKWQQTRPKQASADSATSSSSSAGSAAGSGSSDGSSQQEQNPLLATETDEGINPTGPSSPRSRAHHHAQAGTGSTSPHGVSVVIQSDAPSSPHVGSTMMMNGGGAGDASNSAAGAAAGVAGAGQQDYRLPRRNVDTRVVV